MLESVISDKKIAIQPWMESSAVRKVFAVLGNEARFVGGCVRDTLLGRYVKDIDIATPLLPEKATELLEKAGIKVLPTGIKHGTITALIDKQPLEITTLRRDEACDGRHANVAFTDDWQEDAGRRDFTINALYLDIDGNIYDYFSGLDDLREKIIRFIGAPSPRIIEDYLRILRFFRFSAQLETNNLDEKGLVACGRLAEGLAKLSGERIQAEMFKILNAFDPLHVLNLMKERKILEIIGIAEPNLLLLQKLIEREKNEKETTGYFSIDPVLRLSLLLLPAVLDPTEIAERWKLSRRIKERIQLLLAAKNFPTAEKAAKRVLRKKGKENFLDLARLEFLKGEMDEKTFASMIKLASLWVIPEMPINGDDVIGLGVMPGKDVGELLAGLENWWEEKDYQPEKAELMAKAKALLFPANKGW